jgi:uncharacterized membrane protein YfcA
MKAALFIALGIFTVGYLVVWVMLARRAAERPPKPDLLDYFIGLVTNFFDALGIGSFATTTALFRWFKVVPDEKIPGTLNAGATIPGILEAFIFIAVVDVDVTTLTLMVAASVVGAWLGAGVVSKWPRRKIQTGMGTALLVTAAFGLMTLLHLLPGGGEQLGLHGWKLALAVAANGVLGALMTLGIGLFGPCMMVTYLLGMNPLAVFPIMMGSVAFLGPVASVPFIRRGSYSLKTAIGLTLGGIPGILLAAFLVKSLPLAAVRWLVVSVVVYTAVMMLRSAAMERPRPKVVTEQIAELG